MTVCDDSHIVWSNLGSDYSVVNDYMILETAKNCNGETENIFIWTKEIKTHIMLSTSSSRVSILRISKMKLIDYVISAL